MTALQRTNSQHSLHQPDITATNPTIGSSQISLAFATTAESPAAKISDQTTSMIVTPQQVISLLSKARPTTVEEINIRADVQQARKILSSHLYDLNVHAIGSGSLFGKKPIDNIRAMSSQELRQDYFSDCGVAPEILRELFSSDSKPPIKEELFNTALESAYPQLNNQPGKATQQQFIVLVDLLKRWGEASEKDKPAIHDQLISEINSVENFSDLALCHTYRGTSLFLLVVAGGNKEAISALLNKYPDAIHDLTLSGHNSLELAIDRTSEDNLRALLDHLDDSAKSSELRNQALKFALKYNKPWAINLLIAYGAKITLQPKEKIILADALNAARTQMKYALSSLQKDASFVTSHEWGSTELQLCTESKLSKDALLALYDLSSKKCGLWQRNLTSNDRTTLDDTLDQLMLPKVERTLKSSTNESAV